MWVCVAAESNHNCCDARLTASVLGQACSTEPAATLVSTMCVCCVDWWVGASPPFNTGGHLVTLLLQHHPPGEWCRDGFPRGVCGVCPGQAWWARMQTCAAALAATAYAAAAAVCKATKGPPQRGLERCCYNLLVCAGCWLVCMPCTVAAVHLQPWAHLSTLLW